MAERSLTDFTQALVRQPSRSGEEGALVRLVIGEVRALGYDQTWIDGDGNGVGVINGARPGPTLLCDGHCDTVGIAPGVPWQHEPFGAYRFCTNAAYSAGMAQIPTVGFGPGLEEDAHVIDERLSLAALGAAERGYRGIIAAVLRREN